MRQFDSDFYCFFDFLDRIFFLNGSLNPFTAHSRTSFLFEFSFKFSFLGSGFFVHMRHFDIDFLFFFLNF